MGIFLGSQEKRAAPFFPEPVVPPFPGANVGRPQALSAKPDLALTVPAVWACVSLLANTVSSLPLQTFRRTNDVPLRIPNPKLVDTPSDGMTQSEWLHMLMVSLLLRGNAYGRISARDQQLRPLQIDLMNPDQLDVQQDPDSGQIQYRVRKTQQILSPDDVWHVRGMTMPGSKIGLSPIAYAAATLGIDLNSREFASDFFAGGGVPKAILKSDAPLSQEKATALKERLMNAFRSREPIVVPLGIDYQMISVRPEESQFLATQAANIGQVARFFSIPPRMVGGTDGNSMTYANVEQLSLDFLTYGVSFWLKRLEDSMFPLLAGPQYVKFRIEDLLRTDAHTRAQVDMFQIASKVRTPTEVRDGYGWQPMTEAQREEVNMVPLAIGPLGRPTATPALKLPEGPIAPTPPNDSANGA